MYTGNPFERNRYYAGKLLTSTDFLAEQDYNRGKHQLALRHFLGAGIVSGLSVQLLDPHSIRISPGLAIDSAGREAQLPAPQVCTLSGIEGFAGTKTGELSLCLRVREDETEAVFSVSGEDCRENNRITESGELFLIDTSLLPGAYRKPHASGSSFLSEKTICFCADFDVKLFLPKAVSLGRQFRILLRITKKTDAPAGISFAAQIHAPDFSPASGTTKQASIQDIHLAKGECYSKEFWFTASGNGALDESLAAIILENISCSQDGHPVEAASSFLSRLSVSRLEPVALIQKTIAAADPADGLAENQPDDPADGLIRLCDLGVLRQHDPSDGETAYSIEWLRDDGRQAFVPLPKNFPGYLEALEFFKREGASETEDGGFLPPLPVASKAAVQIPATGPVPDSSCPPAVTSGILEIPLGSDSKKGDISFSGEILHGLGPGNVFVSLGTETISAEGETSCLYGNAQLFSDTNLPEIETCAKVLPEKGSFIAAVKLKSKAYQMVLPLRWVAVQLPSAETGKVQPPASARITAETPTFTMGFLESHYFGVRFHDMDGSQAALSYELTAEGSGTISPDGIYTAPSKEGVFEIRISLVDNPMICTYAYAVVKK